MIYILTYICVCMCVCIKPPLQKLPFAPPVSTISKRKPLFWHLSPWICSACFQTSFEWNQTVCFSGNQEDYEALVFCILPVDWTLTLHSWGVPWSSSAYPLYPDLPLFFFALLDCLSHSVEAYSGITAVQAKIRPVLTFLSSLCKS